MDVLYLGRPTTPGLARQVAREQAVLRAAGLAVAAIDGRGASASSVRPRLVMLMDGRPASVPPHAVVVLRDVEGEPAAIAGRLDRLERRLDRPVLLGPPTPASRRALLPVLAESRLTAVDWRPFIDPMAALDLPTSRNENRCRIGLDADDRCIGRLRERLPACTASGRLVELERLDAARLDRDPRVLEQVEIVVGPLRGPDRPGLLHRTLAGIEGGALPIVGPACGRELEGASLTSSEARLPALLAHLLEDPAALAAARRKVRDRALASFSETDFVERVRALLATSPCPDPEAGDDDLPWCGTIEGHLLIAGDLTRRDEMALRVVAEIRVHAADRHRMLLLHLPAESGPRTIHPAIDACVREGLATPVPPHGVRIAVDRLDLIRPRRAIPALDRLRPRIIARRCRLIEADLPAEAAQPGALHERFLQLYRLPTRWTGLTRGTHETLAGIVPVERQPLRPLALPPSSVPRLVRSHRSVLGCVLFSVDALPALVQAFRTAGLDREWRLRFQLAGEPADALPHDHGPDIEVVDVDGCDLGRFLRGLDALALPPDLPDEEIAWTAAATAAAQGLPVIAPADLAPPAPMKLRTAPLAAWPRLLRRHARAGARAIRPTPRPSATSRRVLMVTANGVGLGHVTRLSAIARRLPAPLEPVFATMSQAVSVLHEMGFAAELLPSYAGYPLGTWNAWLERRIDDLLDHHRPCALVLDASNPYPGVLRAAAPRPEVRLVWVRRGMWRASQDNRAFLARSPCFDLVIEPEDIAASVDQGATAGAREGVLEVPPISLLDEADLLPREQARAELGLDLERPAVLVQLGSGTTRDLASLYDEVFACLVRFEDLQVVNATWLIAEDTPDLWPKVERLTGFPIARYFRAFDFTISAAGYNSFNDILRFGLPAIFIANDAEMMDDQGGRARFAEAAEAAFDLRASDLSQLGGCIAALLDPRARTFLRANAQRLARPNGAGMAAAAIGQLAGLGHWCAQGGR